MKLSGNSDIIIVILITVLLIILTFVPILNDTSIRTLLGIIFILFLPGYSLTACLFTKKNDLTAIERFALSLGLSIMLTPLIAFALNFTPLGIRLIPLILSLSTFTIILILIAYIKRMKTSPDERFTVESAKFFKKNTQNFKNAPKTQKILVVVLITLIVIAIPLTTYVILKPKESEKFTEFYILGPNGTASNYPTNLTLGQAGNVNVVIVNHEQITTKYHLLIKLNNITIKNEDLTLSNNEKKEIPFTFTPSKTGKGQKLEFLLYKLPDDVNIYRSLHLWINVS
ncbi:MAG: DUF1616 domain-containing protein [Methanobacterium sp.]|uniref:DUF1616 domain-containing protein n=1 Tax=Methanobacterium sp. TaxID=2164 RepID=UPI003D65EDF2|nr:DUF1616 domain-containing protein [Methanobacterium sp.]